MVEKQFYLFSSTWIKINRIPRNVIRKKKGKDWQKEKTSSAIIKIGLCDWLTSPVANTGKPSRRDTSIFRPEKVKMFKVEPKLNLKKIRWWEPLRFICCLRRCVVCCPSSVQLAIINLARPINAVSRLVTLRLSSLSLTRFWLDWSRSYQCRTIQLLSRRFQFSKNWPSWAEKTHFWLTTIRN